MNDTKRIIWIDIVKLVACIGVFIGHFNSFFYTFSESAHQSASILQITLMKIFGGINNGDMWVYVFCMLSGYLLYINVRRIELSVVLKKIIKRYFSFVIPLFVIGIIILILYRLNCFQSWIYQSVEDNTWISPVYSYVSFRDVLSFSLLFNHALDGPIWTLRPIFFGNCILWLFQSIIKNDSNRIKICFFLSIVFCVASLKFYYASYTGAVLFGAVLSKLNFRKQDNRLFFVIILLWYMLVSGGYQFVIYLLTSFIGVDLSFLINIRIWFVFSAILIIELKNLKINNNLIINNISSISSEISFPIYLIHNPVLCSFSLWLQTTFLCKKEIGYSTVFFINYVLTFVLVITLSFIYSFIKKKLRQKL